MYVHTYRYTQYGICGRFLAKCFWGSEELAEISNEEILQEVPLLALLGDSFIKGLAEQMQVESLGERFLFRGNNR